ncbi:MAG: DUF4097 domain-containing protein [Eubacterium sp.]|nr:DUF4097 domain-containing protein [Eubacterium sp.]
METIRDYLDNLFLNIKETPQSIKVKEELYQMMEDKYEELIADGKSQSEAIGIVISEFGNFDEIVSEFDLIKIEGTARSGGFNGSAGVPGAMGAGAFGGAGGMGGNAGGAGGMGGNAGGASANTGNSNKTQAGPKFKNVYSWSGSQVEQYIKYSKKHAVYVAFGVALILLTFALEQILDTIGGLGAVGGYLEDIFSGIVFFGGIGAAVLFFINAGRESKKTGNIAKDAVILDSSAKTALEQYNDDFEKDRTSMTTIGVILCIAAFAISSIDVPFSRFLDELVQSMFFVLIGAGVYLFVYFGSIKNRLKELAIAVKKAQMNSEIISNAQPQNEWKYKPDHFKGVHVVAIVVAALVGLGIICSVIGNSIMRGVSLANVINPIGNFRVNRNVENIDRQQAYGIESIDEIEMDIAAGDIEIVPSSGNQIEFSYSGRDDLEPIAEVKDRKLSFEQKKEGFNLFGDISMDSKLTVKVPTSKKVEYDVEAAAGSLKIQDLSTAKTKIDLKAGNCTVNNVIMEGDCDIKASAGSVEFNTVECTGVLGCKVSAGSAQMRGMKIREMDADVSMGELDCDIADDSMLDKYSYDASSSMGEVSIAGQNRGSEYRSTDQTWDGYRIKAKASMGSIKIY